MMQDVKRLIPRPLRRPLGDLARLMGLRGAEQPGFFHTGEDDTLKRGELAPWFLAHQGRVIDKWHHYFEIYETHLARFRNTKVRMLEIGVQNGGSQEMWRDYMGPDALLYGVDINPDCAKLNGDAGEVRIGSQDDPEFLRRVIDEMGGVDVVLDDGSHVMKHIRTSFDTLFPYVSEGGIYIVEDLHTAYWSNFGGGHRRPASFIEHVKSLVDGMHHWYHGYGGGPAMTRDRIFAAHFYDGMIVLEKRAVERPRRSTRGRLAEVVSASAPAEGAAMPEPPVRDAS